MPSYIGILIHVPKLTEEYQNNVFLQMRALLDVCEENLPLEEEVWDLVKDHSSKSPIWRFAADELLLWHLTADEMQEECCFATATPNFAIKLARNKQIFFSAEIKHSERLTTPQVKEECAITGVIHKLVWNRIDQAKLIAVIQNACLILGATYACIDYEYFCPKSIYFGGFRYYGKKFPDTSRFRQAILICTISPILISIPRRTCRAYTGHNLFHKRCWQPQEHFIRSKTKRLVIRRHCLA